MIRKHKWKFIISIILLLIVFISNNKSLALNSDFEYTVENNKATITAYKGSNSVVTIPSTIDGYDVVSIGKHAFDESRNSVTNGKVLTIVIISEGITKIGDLAFNDCTNLETVVLPNSITSLGTQTFIGCIKLKNINIPSNLKKFGILLFQETGFTEFVIPEHFEEIGNSVFRRCTNLRNVKVYSKNVRFSSNVFEYSPNVVLYGYEGSTTQSYAQANGITFKNIEGENNLSSNTALQSLTINKGTLSPKFDPNITNYSAIVNTSNITISATPALGGSVTGIGTKNLNYGLNTFNIISRAEDGSTKTYTIKITREDTRNSDARLKLLEPINNFNSETTQYNITIPNNQETFTLIGTPLFNSSTITYSPSNTINLKNGESNTITVTVTAENGSKKTYTVNITRDSYISNNNDLQNLSVKNYNINFKTNILEYNVTVENNIEEIEISAKAVDNNAQIEGIGKHKIQVGNNIFKIVVKAENGSKKTYIINILRKSKTNIEEKLSNNANIKNIKINDKNIKIKDNIFSYTINVEHNVDSINLTYELEDNKAAALIEGSKTLNVGNNKFKIIVTAEDGSKKSYTINVVRMDNKSDNNKLKSLNIKNASINFNTNTLIYKTTVENNIEEIEISAEAVDKKAKIEGLGKYNIKVGSNKFSIIVTAENGNKKVYTISIIRKDESGIVEKLSNNTNIKNIKINGKDLIIKNNVFTYSTSVENNVNQINLIYELEDEKATAIVLEENNNFKIIVTAEDGTTKNYEIFIERKDSSKTIKNNKESIINEIDNSLDDTIKIVVEKEDTNKIINKEIMEKLKSTNKTLIYEVLNENQGLSYSITISGKNINKVINDLDYELSFESKNKNIIDKLSNNSKSIYLNFKDNNNLPELSTFKIFVGNKFKDNNKLHLYYYNDKTNKLELIESNLNVENGYVEFVLNHFSEYILVDSLIENNNIKIIIVIIMLIIISISLIGCIIYFIYEKGA